MVSKLVEARPVPIMVTFELTDMAPLFGNTLVKVGGFRYVKVLPGGLGKPTPPGEVTVTVAGPASPEGIVTTIEESLICVIVAVLLVNTPQTVTKVAPAIPPPLERKVIEGFPARGPWAGLILVMVGTASYVYTYDTPPPDVVSNNP